MTDWEKIEQLRRENAMLLEQIEYMKKRRELFRIPALPGGIQMPGL